MGIGTLIRTLRLQAGLSQDGLAAELARYHSTVTRDEVKKWEQEKHLPGPMWQRHLAAVLGVTPEEVKAAVTVSHMKRRSFLALGGLTAVNAVLASDLAASTASGDYAPMRDYLTPYAVDHAVAQIVRSDRGAVRKLTAFARDGDTAKLRANAGSILWKTGDADLTESASRHFLRDEQARNWALAGYSRRLLGLSWVDAKTYTGRDLSPVELQAHARELGNQIDAGSRWCAAVVLGQAVRGGNAAARDALLKALRVEPVRENLRLIGLSLVGELPWKEAA